MALSLDSIYKPINDFFVDHFKTDAESPVFFRFDKFGMVLSDQDFIDPNNPGLGYSPELAKEKFSDIVNSVPIEDADGQNIYFSQNNIDTTYHDLWLGPAIPLIAAGDDEATKESIINSFNQIKADALKSWDSIKLESSTGLMFSFKPALATPENWYDRTAAIWTNHLFQVSETVTTPADNTPKFQLWRMKVDDATLQKVLPVENTESINPAEIHNKVLMFKRNIAAPITPVMPTSPVSQKIAMAGTVFSTAMQVSDHRAAQMQNVQVNDLTTDRLGDVLIRDHRADPAPALPPAFRDNLLKSISGLALKQRIDVINYIKVNAPTQPVTTKSLTISFDYCLVDINRPWFHDSFVNSKSWFIPNTAKGQLTAHDTTGGNITVMPIGFLAIKNLNIAASWTAEDITNSKNATDFGPFEVTFDSTSNKLMHEGIQIIGWMLQKMPDLPPNDPPQ